MALTVGSGLANVEPARADQTSASTTDDRDCADSVRQAGQVVDALDSTLHPRRPCESKRKDSLLDRDLGGSQDDAAAVWSHAKCGDLFSKSPPVAILMGTKDETATQKTWYPVCSLDYANTIRKDIGDSDIEKVTDQLRTTVTGLDLCVGPSSAMRDAPGYTSPSQESTGTQEMPLAKRQAYLEKALHIRAQVKEMCCGSEKACRTLMDGVKVDFCKPQLDKKKADPCYENGTFYDMADSDQEIMGKVLKARGPRGIKGHFPLRSGTITLSPLEDSDDGSPVDDSTTVAHEFTHGCSEIRRQLAINSGDRSAFTEFAASLNQYDDDGKPNDGCKIDAATQSVYRGMFRQLQASDNTYSCIKDAAETGATGRFDSSKPCLNGCPRSHLEEGLAMWMQLRTAEPKSEVPAAFKKMCHLMRDNQHPLGPEMTKCALETPAFLALAKEGLGCQ